MLNEQQTAMGTGTLVNNSRVRMSGIGHKSLVAAALQWSAAPPQTLLDDEDDTACHNAVIHPRHRMQERKVMLRKKRLRFTHQKKQTSPWLPSVTSRSAN